MAATATSRPVLPLDRPRTAIDTITSCSHLRRFLQDRLSFEIITFLQAGLLAFNSVGSFLNEDLEFIGVPYKEAARIAFFSGR